MKALDNLENYDIPAGFRLTAEQEVQFASDLKEIVHALIPIRGSKLHTRRYFNSHLRYTSNVQDSIPKPSYPPGLNDPAEPYTPQPGEYTWDSDLLQPALLDILKPDQWSFGFVINYINADIARRQNKRFFKDSIVSDALVKFALAFDVDEIRAKAKAIADPKERLRFLNAKYTDFKIYDGLSRDEEEWVAGPIGAALQALTDEAERDLKLADAQTENSPRQKQKPSRTKSATLKNHNGTDTHKHVLYDFGISSLPQFASLHMEFHGGVLTEPWANQMSFDSIVREMFTHCYDAENNFQRDEVIFEDYPRYILGLLDSYCIRLQHLYRSNPHAGFKLLFEWMQKTTSIIDEAHQAIPTIYEKGKRYFAGDPADRPSVDTWPMKLMVLETLYGAFPNMYGDLKPEVTQAIAAIVPYNMWGDEYEQLREKYTNQFGLEFPKRAVVKVDENRRRFAQVLAEQCSTFCIQMNNISGSREDDEAFRNCYNPMTSFLHGYFADYIKRIQKASDNADEIDQAVIAWLLSLEEEIQICYASRCNAIRRQCGANSRTDVAILRFFYDICEKNVLDMGVEYFQDCEAIPLVPEKKEPDSEPETVTEQPEQPAPDVKPDPEQPKIQHTRRINYKKLYDAWNEKAFTATTLEEFTAAIDYADFSKMMERAENAGQRAGFIGAVKFIIKRLNQHLGSNWYYIACCSIGETPDDLNKLNDTTKQIGKIDTKILSGSIK